MAVLGLAPGDLYIGSYFQYRFLPRLKINAKSLLDDYGFELPDNAFVFFSHQGHTVYYFLTDNTEDDPIVYGFSEGYEYEEVNPFENGPIIYEDYKRLSAFLAAFIVDRESKEAFEEFLTRYA